ncbi:MAG: GtrA family protein [Acidobacteriota bacterium]|nr:GtrA family protein [Acidobacteriota bacterium]
MNSTEQPTLISDGAPPDPKAHGLFAAMRRVLPSGEVIRFLMVGGFNTLFSLALYNAFVLLVRHFVHNEIVVADAAQCLSMPIAITVAFLGYKWFVFRTKGNYLKEWLRCFAVYGVGFPLSLLIVLPAATTLFLHFPVTRPYAANLAGLVNSLVIACYSYFAHKKFSFKR